MPTTSLAREEPSFKQGQLISMPPKEEEKEECQPGLNITEESVVIQEERSSLIDDTAHSFMMPQNQPAPVPQQYP